MKKCKQGYYYCYTDEKCKPIPQGLKMTARFSGGGKEPEETGIDAPTNGNNTNGNGNGNGNSNGGSNGGGVSESIISEKRDGKSAKDKGYSLRDWFKGGGWKQTGGKYDGKPCAKQPGQTTKPYCRDADDRAAMSKEKRDKAAAKKRREDPNPNRKGKAKMVTQNNSFEPEANIVEEEKKKKRDACYHKVKSRYSVWPSAYASGALVKCRKVGAANWGNSTKKESYELSNWRDDFKATEYEFVDLIKPEPLKGEQIDEVMTPKEKLQSSIERSKSTLDMDRKTKDAYHKTRSAMIAAKQLKRDAAELKNEEKIEEGQKCWKGYEKKGTKKMFGKTYNNCVKKEETEIEEKKDPCWDTHKQVGMKKKGGKLVPNCVPKEESNWRSELGEDWQKVNKSDKTDGMSQKAVNAYRRENPGSKLKTAVTGNPKKGSKDAKRRSSYCSRSEGQKDMHNIDCTKTPDKAICKARRRWKC